MRGTRVAGRRISALVGAAWFVAVALSDGRADACIAMTPSARLAGVPEDGERGVPTTVLPLFMYFDANGLSEATLPRASFEIVSASGAAIAVTARPAYVWQFELVPERELEPETAYSIHATLPASTTGQPSVAVSLSFTTGNGPAPLPEPPRAALQHYRSTATTPTICGPSADGSCLFFPEGEAVEVTFDSSSFVYLLFDPMWTNLSGLNQGTSDRCATLRTRGADGSLSEPVTLCREDGEAFTIPDVTGLNCTPQGLTKDGVPLGDSGAGTGGGGNSPGAPEEERGSRRIVTEGCGCRVGRISGDGPGSAWFAVGIFLLARRRRACPPPPRTYGRSHRPALGSARE